MSKWMAYNLYLSRKGRTCILDVGKAILFTKLSSSQLVPLMRYKTLKHATIQYVWNSQWCNILSDILLVQLTLPYQLFFFFVKFKIFTQNWKAHCFLAWHVLLREFVPSRHPLTVRQWSHFLTMKRLSKTKKHRQSNLSSKRVTSQVIAWSNILILVNKFQHWMSGEDER